MCGTVLTKQTAKAVQAAAREAGFSVNTAAADMIRLAPPLVITKSQIEQFVARLPDILDKAAV